MIRNGRQVKQKINNNNYYNNNKRKENNSATEATDMSDRAEMRGPSTRRRRTTISGSSGGAVSAKQANGSKCHDAGEKPPHYPAKGKPEEEVHKHASNNGKTDREPGVSGQQQQQKQQPKQQQQQQITNSARKQRSAVEDINERLR